MRPTPLAERRAPAGAEDELTELLAELLVRAWRRRHPAESPPSGTVVVGIAEREPTG